MQFRKDLDCVNELGREKAHEGGTTRMNWASR